MDSGQAADLALFIVSAVLLLLYNVFYFNTRSFRLAGRSYTILYAVNRRSRRDWVQLLAQDSKEGINAVQTVRNQILAVSILAAATTPLASTLINVMTDAGKMDQVSLYAEVDPITDNTLIAPQLKLGLALGLLLLAVMAFAQSVRLSVHVGYTIRVVASDPGGNAALLQMATTFMARSSLYFAVGLRLLFAVGPFLLYLLGPTALIIATVLDIAAQAAFDVVPSALCDPRCEEEERSGRSLDDAGCALAAAGGPAGAAEPAAR